MTRAASCAGAVIAGFVLGVAAWGEPLRAQGARTGTAAASPVPAPRPEEAAAASLLERGKPREALAEIDRAAAAYRRAGDRLGLARAALTRSAAWRVLGDLAQAARDADEARTFGAGDPVFLTRALTQVARIATE